MRKVLLFSSLIFISFAILSISIAHSTQSESKLKPHISFYIHFYPPNFENYTVKAQIQSFIESVQLDKTSILIRISNCYTVDETRFADDLHLINIRKKDNWTVDGTEYFNYKDEHSIDFRFFGSSELYPFDSYFLNLTFSFQDYGEIRNDTEIIVEARMLFEHQSGWNVEPYTEVALIRPDTNQDFAYINKAVLLTHMKWSVIPLLTVLTMGFLVLGSVVFIDPDDLRSKSALYTAMFVFFGTFYFNFSANVPKRYSLSVGENMILLLIAGAAIFLVSSIIQYKLSKLHKFINSGSFISKLLDQIMIFLPILIVIWTVLSLFGSARSLAQRYFWINIPSEFPYVLSLIVFGLIQLLVLVIDSLFGRKAKGNSKYRIKKCPTRFE